MDELEVTLGQRTLTSVHGDQTTATAYAGFGTRHLLLVADGADGRTPSRLAAQVGTSAATARFRASVFPRTDEQLREAFTEAHAAVRRGALGTHAEGEAGASMVAVVIEAEGVTAARVGGGRVYVLDGDVVRPLFRDAGEGLVGDASCEPELARTSEHVYRGVRVVVMTEAVARGVIADLDHLAVGSPPQLSAARLADAARRRGQYEPLAVQVVEVQHAPERPGPHPAVGRLDRGRSRTLSADGRWLGGSDNDRTRSRRARTEAGWILWIVFAVLLGAGLALIVHDDGPPAPTEPPARHAAATAPPPAEVAPPPKIVPDAVATPQPAQPAMSPEREAEIRALLEHQGPRRISRALRGFITRNYPDDGDQVFKDLEAVILASDDPDVVAALLDLMTERRLKKTNRWITDLLPRLYARQPPQDAAP